MLKFCIQTVVLALILIASASAESPFCVSDMCDSVGCDSVGCDSVGCDGLPCGQYSGRAFLFAWPGNNASDLRLNYAEPLVTDRPDFTEATSTVGLGVTQFELGYTYVRNDDTGTDQHSSPELLIRRGIWKDWLELRIAYTGLAIADPIEDITGSDDLYLGFKIGLTPQCGCLPEMSIMPQMLVPTGSSALTNGEVLPGVNWLWGWDLNERWTFTGNTQVNRAVDDSQPDAFTIWTQSLALSTTLTDRLGVYGEWFGYAAEEGVQGLDEQYLSGGLTVLFGNNVQWDFRGGVGLNDDSDDYFFGTGLSLRFL
ncbi:MAG: transporter [Rubripirellula sp.]|nr:transporter [Rubripirellula sp.]